MKNSSHSRAFSLVEILVALAILALLLGIGATVLLKSRSTRQLETITDTIASKLEEAKTNSMSGKGNQNYGMAFASTSYTYWYGTSYSSSDPNNVTIPISDDFVINTTLSGYAVRFARITGIPNSTGTTTITSRTNASTTDSIVIGTYGGITVIK